MRDRFRRLLVVAALVAGLAACEGVTPLAADAVAPPSNVAISPIKIPDWAGAAPTPYDGVYEGYQINESFYFFCPTADIYLPLAFDISNGLVRRIFHASLVGGVAGYINRHGVFVANAAGKQYIGSIAADQMRGQWRLAGPLCHGRIELVRVVGDQRYCEDRLSGKPYATGSECRGIDRFLTKREFEAMLKTTGKN